MIDGNGLAINKNNNNTCVPGEATSVNWVGVRLPLIFSKLVLKKCIVNMDILSHFGFLHRNYSMSSTRENTIKRLTY